MMNRKTMAVRPQRPANVFFQSRIMPEVDEALFEINAQERKHQQRVMRAIFLRKWHRCNLCSTEEVAVKITGINWDAHQLNHRVRRALGFEAEWIEELRTKASAARKRLLAGNLKGRTVVLARRALAKSPERMQAKELAHWLRMKPSGNSERFKARVALVALQLFGIFVVVPGPLPFTHRERWGTLPHRPVKLLHEYAARIMMSPTMTILIEGLLSQAERDYLRDEYRVKEVVYKHVLYGPREPLLLHIYERKN